MDVDPLPEGLVPAGGTLNFTDSTVPEAIQREHALAPGRWGVLHVLEGSLLFVDLETEKERRIDAPGLVVIQPQASHRVAIEGPLVCRLDFFREP